MDEPSDRAEHRDDRRGIDRRRLDEVFGDVLPATTGDERERADAERGDEQLLADRPPHHDREY